MNVTVELYFTEDRVIKWKYIDNPLSRKHYSMLKDAVLNAESWWDFWYSVPEDTIPKYDIKKITSLVSDLREKVKQINEYVDPSTGENIKFPVDVDDIYFEEGQHLKNQKLINQIHRCFTTFHLSLGDVFSNYISPDPQSCLASWYYTIYDMKEFFMEAPHKEPIPFLKENYDENKFFKVRKKDIKDLKNLTEDLNDLVHALEKYNLNPRKYMMRAQLDYREFNVNFKPRKLYNLSPTDKKFLTQQVEVNVWAVQNEILGKSYPICYVDHDDPTNWDIWEGLQWSGSFCLGDRRYTKWKPFTDWMSSYGYVGAPAGIPLGTIIEGSQYFNHNSLLSDSLKNIIIREEDKVINFIEQRQNT